MFRYKTHLTFLICEAPLVFFATKYRSSSFPLVPHWIHELWAFQVCIWTYGSKWYPWVRSPWSKQDSTLDWLPWSLPSLQFPLSLFSLERARISPTSYGKQEGQQQKWVLFYLLVFLLKIGREWHQGSPLSLALIFPLKRKGGRCCILDCLLNVYSEENSTVTCSMGKDV